MNKPLSGKVLLGIVIALILAALLFAGWSGILPFLEGIGQIFAALCVIAAIGVIASKHREAISAFGDMVFGFIAGTSKFVLVVGFIVLALWALKIFLTWLLGL